MKYYYEYKLKNGAKVGGHNLEKITFNEEILILSGFDTIHNFYQVVRRPWRFFLKSSELEYLKIEPMEEE